MSEGQGQAVPFFTSQDPVPPLYKLVLLPHILLQPDTVVLSLHVNYTIFVHSLPIQPIITCSDLYKTHT